MLKPGDAVDLFDDTKLWSTIDDIGLTPCDMYATRAVGIVIAIVENAWKDRLVLVLTNDVLRWTYPEQLIKYHAFSW